MGTKFIDNQINVKLCYRESRGSLRYHVIVPEGQRFNYHDFLKLKDHLKRQFSNFYNKSLYLAGTPRWYEEGKSTPDKDQPVFEYFCEKEDLQRAIETFGKTHLAEYEFSFATVNYDFVSELKEVPLDIVEQSRAEAEIPEAVRYSENFVEEDPFECIDASPDDVFQGLM